MESWAALRIPTAIAPRRRLPLASSAPSASTQNEFGVERGLWPQICLPPEIDWLESQPEALRATAATLIFSAKEAFYKCLCGAGGGWLEFHDVAIKFTEPKVAENGTFLAELLRRDGCRDSAERALAGAFRVDGELVMTGLALMACG